MRLIIVVELPGQTSLVDENISGSFFSDIISLKGDPNANLKIATPGKNENLERDGLEGGTVSV